MRRRAAGPSGLGPRHGFTLIELLAVLMIFGLLASVAVPNFGLRSGRELVARSKRLAGDLEFARQRAVMTGLPHRVVFDLDAGVYWLEWRPHPEEPEPSAGGSGPPTDPSLLSLAPPERQLAEFRPMAGSLGEVTGLGELVQLAELENAEGRVRRGSFEILFEGDGTTDPAWVHLEDDRGSALTLEVAPLADTVRFVYGDA